ncbi:MAG: peptidyl-alpha-hydroxyglycine alpha-amidating lyase family protein [Gemmatimonadaceae bacterium]
MCSVVHGWPTLPAGQLLGQATGVGIDSKGAVLVFHRAGRTWTEPFPTEPISTSTVWAFDGKTGRFLRSWGAGMFIMPHGLDVDRNDNVWVTDVGRQQVFKFAADGRVLLTLGERGVAGSDSAHFNFPTDVAVRPDGGFYVSDGYRNTRVLRFDAQGRFLNQWGKPGKGPGEFDLPHGLALDNDGRVYVADRGNSRVQVFDSTGGFVADWHGPLLGRPYGVAVSPDGTIFSVDGGDQPTMPPDRGGVTHLRADGTVLERFGGFGNYDGQFRLAHDVAVAPDGAVYVVDAWGQRVQKFTCRSPRRHPKSGAP